MFVSVSFRYDAHVMGPLMKSSGRNLKPFHVHIATLFIMLFTLLGGALLAIQFQQGMQQGLEHARQSFAQYREQLSLTLKLNEQPARMSLNLLRSSQLADINNLEARLSYLAQMVAVLDNTPSYGAVYIGYQDGDFFLVRKLGKVNRGALLEKAPNNSRWLVQSMHRGVGEFLYYDKDLALVKRHIIPTYIYDPRSRDWYKQANKHAGIMVTRPYLFFTTKEPGMTVAVKSLNRRAVIGLDISVTGLSTMIGSMGLPEQTKLVVFDANTNLLATNPADMSGLGELTELPTLAMLNYPAINALQQLIMTTPAILNLPTETALSTDSGDEWLASLSPLEENSPIHIALMVSRETLQAQVRNEALVALGWSVIGILLLLPLIWLVSRRTATPLQALTKEAERIQHFDFSEGQVPESAIREIDDLARTMSGMRLTLGNFMNMGRALAAEHRFDSLLNRILNESIAAVQARGGCLYLAQQQQMTPVQARWQQVDLPVVQVPWQQELLSDLAFSSQRISLSLDEATWTQHLSSWAPFSGSCKLVAEPLCNHRGELIGCLLLILPHCGEQEQMSRISLIEALAGTCASAIENQRLLEEQKQLLESFIELIAGAIDAKSPYTGGHCQRVPELTKMLTEAACAQQQGPFANFNLNDEEWEAIHIASWLHDCGKVTTPEFVVDKATKLETIYDRIHEIRTRFEVLKRDVYIECLAARLPDEIITACREEAAPLLAELDQEFAFVAECNLGSEWMAPEKIERLDAIASRTWLRTLDDRLGISREELKLRHSEPAATLPCTEQLLADKCWHLIPRPGQDRFDEQNQWRFKVKVPDYLYNRGERYNLAISRGTLTEEERYKINEHIIQSIRMLERLPFPRHLRSVPEIAGGHHERMDGKGYPRQLTGQQMSMPARIMAIADIFEALTASDRPYKLGKSVSQALVIMARMVREQHIDPDLFILFVSSGLWREYALRFLSPDQLDEVDELNLLKGLAVS